MESSPAPTPPPPPAPAPTPAPGRSPELERALALLREARELARIEPLTVQNLRAATEKVGAARPTIESASDAAATNELVEVRRLVNARVVQRNTTGLRDAIQRTWWEQAVRYMRAMRDTAALGDRAVTAETAQAVATAIQEGVTALYPQLDQAVDQRQRVDEVGEALKLSLQEPSLVSGDDAMVWEILQAKVNEMRPAVAEEYVQQAGALERPRYQEADQLVARALRLDPNNARAKELQATLAGIRNELRPTQVTELMVLGDSGSLVVTFTLRNARRQAVFAQGQVRLRMKVLTGGDFEVGNLLDRTFDIGAADFDNGRVILPRIPYGEIGTHPFGRFGSGAWKESILRDDNDLRVWVIFTSSGEQSTVNGSVSASVLGF